MIPALLAAPAAKEAAKYLGLTLAIVLIFFWGYIKGKGAVQMQWDAAIAKQAQESALQVIAEAQMSNEVLKDHAAAERHVETKLKIIEKEVVRYVTTTTNVCPLDTEFIRLYDELRRVLDTDEDGVPPADASPGEFVESARTDVTTADILHALTEFVVQVKQSALTYNALVQWERGRYAVQQGQRETD